LGPATFPLALSIPLAAFSLYLIVRPDPDPEWARGRALLKQALTLIVFVAYAYMLEPLGFIVATLLEVAALGWLLGAKLWQSAAAGLAIAVILYLLFNSLLGLPLPAGVLALRG
jgi:putative tricarboxylic transport membrane protein